MQNSRILITTALVAAALSGTAATSASADSIAYLKGGDVWLTTTDGARQFQVTSTGGYSHVSQADDGTLAAVAGGAVRRLDRLGNVLSEIETPVSNWPSTLFRYYGPFDADISPSGKTIAYGWWSKGYESTSGVLKYEEHNGHGFTKSGSLTGFTDPGYKYAKSWDAPEWIDESTVLVGNGPGYPSDPFAIETVGSGDPKSWFTDPQNMHPLEPTISRNKRVIAAVRGPGRKGLDVYRDGDAQLLGTTYSCFTYSDAAAAFESPTLNADGTLLAFSTGTTLEVAPIGDMSTTCADGQNSKTIAQGATSPDWGPADVPLSRPTPAPTPTPVPVPTGGLGGGTTVKPGGNATLENGPNAPGGAQNGQNSGPVGGDSLPTKGNDVAGGITISAAKRKLKVVVRSGLPVTVEAQPGSLVLKATVGGTVVAKRTVTVGRTGRATVTLKLSAAASKRLRSARSAKVELSATQGTASGHATAQL